MSESKALQLRKLYAKVPHVPCKMLCQRSCGPIASSREERRLIVKSTGSSLRVNDDLTCVFLKDGLCSIRELRPLLCRLYGAVESLRCPYGCVPERMLTDDEGRAFLAEANRIGGKDDRWKRDMDTVVALLNRKQAEAEQLSGNDAPALDE